MTENDAIELLRHRCEDAGSIAAFARAAHLSRSYVSEVIHGRDRLGPALIVTLGLKRVTSFEPR